MNALKNLVQDAQNNESLTEELDKMKSCKSVLESKFRSFEAYTIVFPRSSKISRGQWLQESKKQGILRPVRATEFIENLIDVCDLSSRSLANIVEINLRYMANKEDFLDRTKRIFREKLEETLGE